MPSLSRSLVADYGQAFGQHLSLPEYRQLDLYARKKRVPIAEDDLAETAPPAGLLGLVTAFTLLETELLSRQPELEGKTLWERYLALPKRSAADKLVAEVYRILRIVRLASAHPEGRIDGDKGLVRLFCTYDRLALTLAITPLGLDLLRSFVVYYLDSLHQPYGDAYVEAMLMEYFLDITDEVKSFFDEDRVLFQFRRKYFFNRTHRFDCDSPRLTLDGTNIVFDINPSFANEARYPIDIFAMIDGALHIIPVEALTGFALPIAELPRWRARSAALPAQFRPRFWRATQIPGQPMS